MQRKLTFLLSVVALMLILVGCAEEQPQEGQAGDETVSTSGQATGPTEALEETTVVGMPSGDTSGGTTVTETTGGTTSTTGGMTAGATGGGTTVSTGEAGGEVAVGGFVVETPDAPDTTVPEVNVSRQDAREYLDQVQPIIENSVQDFSNLADPEVSVQDGNLTLDVPVNRLENTRSDIRDGLDQLREIEPPQSLEPINQQLIDSYEQTLPAYTDIIEAANSGDVDRISSAFQENLPRIERFNSEARAILQDLEQAADTQQ